MEDQWDAVRSPLYYVANVKTPTMVMTGEHLRRSGRARVLCALKMLEGHPAVRMPDEYHGWRRPSHQLAQQLYLMAWFSTAEGESNLRN